MIKENAMADEIRITIDEFVRTVEEKLEKHGESREEARQTAKVFGLNAADGVISHSVLRVWRLLSHLDCGLVVPGNMPVLVSGFSAVERYDGNRTSGVISASFCMERACGLADKYGIGMVALRNANHWMRGGYYGWMAAERGKVGICWTNTMANLPSWGSKVSNIGNNPFVMAVPCPDGKHFVLDSAMAQYSMGKLEVTRRAGKLLPVEGGYDTDGNLTRDPAEIEKTRRALPIGFWKGSSMSILLDAAGALLSDGKDVSSIMHYMKENGSDESMMSQVFIAINPEALGPNDFAEIQKLMKDNIHNAEPVNEGSPSRYPGERVLKDREKALREGIMVPKDAWERILSL